MERPGDQFHCPHCDEPHVVKEDEDGFSPGLEFTKLYVECPTYDGVIVWAAVAE
ncbi:hypothetical protein [Natrarchaeobius oligotrophus]|uniref:hypothetical protein n=1 Tax=Natrarchaeobius oligotrophus TaxID=3455743 RepID=UPI0014048FC3|nr:hypothetical protein [Natrarchaeobius chitinivorans]